MPGHEEAKKNCDTSAPGGEVHSMVSEPPRPTELNEPDWLRYRIARLESLLPHVEDKQASTAIRELIAEARERLARLDASSY
jgi:Ser/Thr protein kinase RdoA (MazF antagonist)